MIYIGTTGLITRHKWKSMIAAPILGYGAYKCYGIYKKYNEGISEFYKIMNQFDQMKEGENFEEGSNEELNFMQNIMDKLKENVDPALKTLISNIQKNEYTQKHFIINQVKTELRIEELQGITKTGESNKAKLEAWEKLRVEAIREVFYYIFVTQTFLVCSYIVFSMTGKQLFEINSGKEKLNSLTGLSSALENLSGNNVISRQSEVEEENK